MQITEADREAARAEHEAQKAKHKKSPQAIARLQELAQREKDNREANTTLIARFYEQVKASPDSTVAIIMDWMYRIAQDCTTNIRKRATKAAHELGKHTLSTIHDLMFLGELLPEECGKHLDAIETRYPFQGVLFPIDPTQTAKVERRCSLGSRCLRAYRRKGAIIPGSGKYCSPACAASAPRRLKTAQKGLTEAYLGKWALEPA